ncbi:MAG: C39 family peptidase [Leptospiraceae bacterium]|nr:C39 family peptidase [Leptospiraceae bacterium]
MFSEPYPRHLTQRDNVNPHKPEVNTPASQCSIATFTMLMNWIGDKYNIPEFSKLTEFDLYLVMENVSQFKGINRIGSSLTALHAFNMLLEQDKYKAQMVNNYGHYVKAVLSEAPSPEKLFDIMDKNQCPVWSSTGTALSKPDGHFFCVTGHSNNHILVNDPYGYYSERDGKYFNVSGKAVIYNDSLVKRIYEPTAGGRNIIYFKKIFSEG